MSQIAFKCGVFSSIHNRSNQLFAGGSWGSASRRAAWAEGVFDGVYEVERITLAMAGSDMTSHHSIIKLLLRGPDGGYVRAMPPLLDSAIARGQTKGDFSLDHANPPALKAGFKAKRDFTPALDLALAKPVKALAVLLQLEGHGWFAASDLRCFGKRVAGLPEGGEEYPDAHGLWLPG